MSFSSFLLFFVLLLFEIIIIFFFFFFSEFCSWLAFSVCVVWQSVREWHPKLYPNLRQWQHKLVLNATFVLDQSHLKPDIFPIPKEILQMANPANKVIKFCRKRVSTSTIYYFCAVNQKLEKVCIIQWLSKNQRNLNLFNLLCWVLLSHSIWKKKSINIDFKSEQTVCYF